MPQSHLWLLNNLGNSFTLGTQQPKFTQLANTWTETVTVKRLSSSSWCAWAIGHDHRVYSYILSSDVPIRVPDTLYENQRKIPYRGFSKSYLLFTDRFPWSDEKGTKETPKESVRLPSVHWKWEGDWMVDENLRGEVVGIEGWQYAVDFPSVNYTTEEHWQTFVRKRKWIRFRRFVSTDTWVRISDMEVVDKSECFIDISVGGFCLPSQPQGFLSVWAVTNNGYVYVRKNVCQDNPEGDSWQEITLGSRHGIINISVGASNLLWAITWDGQALVRTGINRNNVYGTQWEVVECPDNSIRFKQIAVGRNVVWALSRDDKVWFRKGTWGDDIQGNVSSLLGTMWVEMVGEMSHIAVSANDQVFAIGENGKHVFFRSGVTPSNLTGKTWQQVSLHEDVSVFQHDIIDACTCIPENPHSVTLCDFHKDGRRTASFTTSCSSSSIYSCNEDTPSDVFLSPQSPVSFLSSFNKDVKNNVNELKPKITEVVSVPSQVSVLGNQHVGGEKGDEDVQVVSVDQVICDKNDAIYKDQKAADHHIMNVNSISQISLAQPEKTDLNIDYHSQTCDSNLSDLSQILRTEGNFCDKGSGNENIDENIQNTCEENYVMTKSISNEKGCDTEYNVGCKDSDYESFSSSITNSDTKTDETHYKTKDTHASDSKNKKAKHKHTKRPENLTLEDTTDSIVFKNPKGKKKRKRHSALKEDNGEMVPENHDSRVANDKEHDLETENGAAEIERTVNIDVVIKQTISLKNSSQSVVEEKIDSIKIKEDNVTHQHESIKFVDDSSKVNSALAIVENICQSTNYSEQTQSNPLTIQVRQSSVKEQESEISKNSDTISSEPPMISLKIDSIDGKEPFKSDKKLEPRRLSVDSPVSDGIIDFVSYFDSDGEKDNGEYNEENVTGKHSYSDHRDNAQSNLNRDEECLSELMNINSQYSHCSELSTPDGRIPNDSFDPTSSSSSFNASTHSPEIAQLMLIQPARKVIRYHQSPSIPQQSSSMADPMTFSQDRYFWKWIDVSALQIDDPNAVKWLRAKTKDSQSDKAAFKIESSVCADILKKLRARNRREIHPFINFEQAVKMSAWVKKATMQIFVKYKGGQWVNCGVEWEQSKTDRTNQCLNLVYAERKNQKVKQLKRVLLNELICVKRCTDKGLRSVFSVYTSSNIRNPHKLQAPSEAEAKEWINLLCAASSRQFNLDCPIPHSSIWSCTKTGDVLVSPACSKISEPEQRFWGHHGGHMSLVETGAGGVTWGIGFDHMPYVYNGGYGGAVCLDVVGMSTNLQEMTDTGRVYVYENEMWYPGLGWCTKGLLSNNFNWITEDGRSVESREDVQMPSSKWQWVSGWTIDFNTPGGVDSQNGWQYSCHWSGLFHEKKHIRDTYRRKRWVRICGLNTQGPWQSAGSLGLLAVSVQVDPVYSSTDPIVLWAVATNGNVLCRYGVTQDNPLGQSWVNVPTDLDKPFVSISVGGGFRVWGIASDGSMWFRSGVTQYMPTGQRWLQVVECPSSNGILRMVSAGATAVWAVDTEDNLWRRRNITSTFPEGTDWELVASRVKTVSVGPNNEVWITVDSRFNRSHEGDGVLHRRVGITEAKPNGTKWERVIGDGWACVCVRGMADNLYIDSKI